MNDLNEKPRNNNITKSKKDSYTFIYKNKIKDNKKYYSKSYQKLKEDSKDNKINDNNQNDSKLQKESCREKLEIFFSDNSKILSNNLKDSQKKENYGGVEKSNKKLNNNKVNNNKNINFIMEKIYSVTYLKNDKDITNIDMNNKENFTNQKNNIVNMKKLIDNKLQDNNENFDQKLNNKILKEDEKKINLISNLSSIENEKISNRDNSLNKIIKNNDNIYNSYDKEIIDININNLEEKEKELFKNVYSPIISDIKINSENEPIIYEVNCIKTNKTPNIEQLIKFNETENSTSKKEYILNNENIKINYINNKDNNIKDNNINYKNNDKKKDKNSIKNKLNEYLNKIEEKNKSVNYNMRLKYLKERINKNKYKEEENTKKITYPGLKRYRHYSTPSLKQFQARTNNINANLNDINERRQNKLNIIKKTINNICNLNNNGYDTNHQNIIQLNNLNKLKKINNGNKINNKTKEQIYRNIIEKSINNNHEKHLNNILNGLNNTIKKFGKNDENEKYIKINMNQTSRTFPSNLLEFNGINKFIKTNKNNNVKNIHFNSNYNYNYNYNYNKYKFKSKYNERNEKLLFETKVNNMNNTIIKLLQKCPEFYSKNNSTQPPNIFIKNKSISNINKNKIYGK